MPDDENYQINQHPWLVLTTITPSGPRHRCHCHGMMFSVTTWTPHGWPRQWQPGGMRDLLVVAITILPSPTFNPSLGTLSSQDSQALRTVDWHWHHCYKVSYQNIFNGSILGNSSDSRTFVNISLLCIDKELSNISWSALPLPIPIAHHKILMRYVLLPVFHFIITPGPYLRQPLNFPSKDQICLILNLNFHVPTTASLAGHWGKHNYVRLSTVSCDQSVSIPQLVFIGPIF